MMSQQDKKINGRLALLVVGLLVCSSLHAGIPLWTYSTPNPLSVAISDGGTATVQYTVTNQSHKTKNLVLRTTSGLSASSCYLAGMGSTCNIILTINGSEVPEQGIHSGPIFCDQNNLDQCYQPSAANVLNVVKSTSPPVAVISAAPSSLTLTTLSPGNTGMVTITNNGPIAAYGVGISSAPGLGVTVSGVCASPMMQNDTCELTFTSASNTGSTTATIAGSNTNSVIENINVIVPPASLNVTAVTSPAVIAVNGSGVQLSIENTGGITAYNVVYNLPSGWNGVSSSASCGDISPAPGPGNTCTLTFTADQPNVANTIDFSADNAPTTQSPFIAFSYYGYLVFSTTGASPGTAKVVLDTEKGPFAWDANCQLNGTGCSVIDAQDLYNGSVNTNAIVAALPGSGEAALACYNITNDNTPVQPVSTGTWYLPAICQTGSSGDSANCSPGTANLYGNLAIHGFGSFSGFAWSSTDASALPCFAPGACAWEQGFVMVGGFQNNDKKGFNLSVWCVRSIAY